MSGRNGIICAGNWIVDLVHEISAWPNESDLERIIRQSMGIGGGAANVSLALSRIDKNLPIWPMGAVGTDEYGQFVLAECKKYNLPINLMHSKQGITTAHTHVMSVIGKSRTFFYHGGANDSLTVEDFPKGTFGDSTAKLFYFGYIMLLEALDKVGSDGSTGASAVLKRAQEAGLITCVDLVSAQRPDFAESVGAALPYIDYLIVNEVEAARATNTAEGNDNSSPTDEDLSVMARKLLDSGVQRGVVIHCPETAIWMNNQGHIEILHSEKLDTSEIVSPLGAGDAFCAGVMYALHHDWQPIEALRLGHSAARACLSGATATEAIPELAELM